MAITSGNRKKTSKGRQKIEMKLISDLAARRVSFSKRRRSLFDKANELSILCGAELALVVFSGAGKPFSFVHPSVAARFLSAGHLPDDHGGGHVIDELTTRLAEMKELLEAEFKRRDELEEALRRASFLDGTKIEGLGMGELEGLRVELERLKAELLEDRSSSQNSSGGSCGGEERYCLQPLPPRLTSMSFEAADHFPHDPPDVNAFADEKQYCLQPLPPCLTSMMSFEVETRKRFLQSYCSVAAISAAAQPPPSTPMIDSDPIFFTRADDNGLEDDDDGFINMEDFYWGQIFGESL